MDYRKKYLNRTGFKSGSGIVASAPWYRGTTGPSQILKAPRGYTGMQEILAGGILGTGASKFLEDEDKENLPVETEETKLPKKEPPEDPDLLPELTKQTAEEVIRKETKEKDKLSDEEWDFLHDILTYRDLPKQIKDKVDKLLTNKKTTFTENQFNKLAREMNEHYARSTSTTAPAPESPHTDYTEIMGWDDIYTGTGYEEGFFKKENEYENLKVKIRKVTNLSKGKTWKPGKLEFKDVIEQTDKLTKKAHGGLIDRPLTGGSRYI